MCSLHLTCKGCDAVLPQICRLSRVALFCAGAGDSEQSAADEEDAVVLAIT